MTEHVTANTPFGDCDKYEVCVLRVDLNSYGDVTSNKWEKVELKNIKTLEGMLTFVLFWCKSLRVYSGKRAKAVLLYPRELRAGILIMTIGDGESTHFQVPENGTLITRIQKKIPLS